MDGLDDPVFGSHGGGEMKIAVMAGLPTKWDMNINTCHVDFSWYPGVNAFLYLHKIQQSPANDDQGFPKQI
jgi:hypothetical protein